MSRYVIRGGREGYERLRVIALAHRSNTLELFDRLAVRAPMRCLDLGCGGGEVTFELARLVKPGGFAIGIDMDAVKLELAREAAGDQGITNVEFRQADATGFADEAAYDLVYCRLLLEHMSRPAEVLRRMWAAVRPGGMLAVEDADFDGLFCHPPNEGFDFYARTYPAVLRHHGGDPTIGRRLHSMFVELGIHGASVRMVQRANVSGEVKTLALSTLDATTETIVGAGIASEEEVAAARADLAAFTDDPDTLIGGPRIFQVWAGPKE